MLLEKEFDAQWVTNKKLVLIACIPFTYSPTAPVVDTIMAGFKNGGAKYYMRTENLMGVIFWVIGEN